MRAIFGLGNPGRKYKLSRHNVGHLLVDYLAEKHSLTFLTTYNYLYTEGELNNSPFVLIKPTTYMNNSGIAAKEVFINYALEAENFLVVYDDIYLKKGEIRIRQQGGDGGHNGLSSIIYHIETSRFPRLRIGLGYENTEKELSEFVLDKFSRKELAEMEVSFNRASGLIEQYCSGGIKAMLDFFSRGSKD